MSVKKLELGIVTDRKHVRVHVFDVDQIEKAIAKHASSDKLSSALAEVLAFAEHAANVCDDAHAIHIDAKNYAEHLDAHPKGKAAKKSAKKKAKKSRAKSAEELDEVDASELGK